MAAPPPLPVYLTEEAYEYLLSYLHLRRAEALNPRTSNDDPKPPTTGAFDFLPPELESGIIEAVLAAAEHWSDL